MRVAGHICVMLLAIQTVLSAGYFPERCCDSEWQRIAATASQHTNESGHHWIGTKRGAESCHLNQQSCLTSSAALSACLCQCAEGLRPVVTLRQQGYLIPQYQTVLSGAISGQWLGPIIGPHLRMFSVYRSHSPPGNGFGLNLRV